MKIDRSGFTSAKRRHEKKLYPIQMWDFPTRIFHWLLVVLIIISFITGKIGGNAMQYHELSGFAVLILVLFRLVWGVVGGQHSRFISFVKGPAAVARYASSLYRKDAERHLGHNPLGGYSIISMLISTLIQVGTGLFANDDILMEGPLFDLVSKKTSDWLTGIHHLNVKVLLFLIVIHICAIIFYLFVKRESLLKPMITGTKLWHQNIKSFRGNPVLAIFLITVIAVAGYLIIY